ncbi:MAG: methionine synthase [Gloeocapsa sp. DLM2.Bin57]|nr:MAG: methionine synthase [Gloeocapsa sp. DLM2.Bin57]
MTRGIYIVANDRVVEQAITLVNSIRLYDPDLPIILIPFNQEYQQVAKTLQTKHRVELFPDLQLIETFTTQVATIFPADFLNLPNKMRKFVQWFGPLEEFIYIDTDIVVFQPLSTILDYLTEYNFLCCDYHHKSKRLQDIFSPLVEEQNIFNSTELRDVFNSGFWASQQGLFSEDELYQLLEECAQHPEYFDFSSKTTDQPILNYVILKSTKKKINLTKNNPKEPGSWAGSTHFVNKDYILYDQEKRLRYLHWAGIAIKPGCPYWHIWKHYRYLGESFPKQWWNITKYLSLK